MASYLSALARAKGKEERRALLNTYPPDVFNKINECAYNTLKGNVHLTPGQKRRLQPFRKQLRTLANRRVPKKIKKRILIQSGGAILPLLLGPLAGLLGSLFSR